ncbi:MAG: ABC transporter ATP-binding protein [Syntrophorhabdales bacterium]|jgi:branched-chain amino acid transport system ATP-binding protein
MPILDVRGISKAFGGLLAVNDTSFYVNEGEIVGLIGPNGAGKTTVFHLISGYYRPDRGAVFFEEQDITGKRPSKICKLGLTRTFQKVQPFPTMTVLENVLVGCLGRFGRIRDARVKALEVLEITELVKIKDRMGESLTLGQWKLLEIAKALATDPSLLLLDEVLAGMNGAEVMEALILIRQIKDRGVTILMVEHVMQAIMALSDRIVVLANGAKIAEGSPQDVTQNEHVIKAYLGDDFLTM